MSLEQAVELVLFAFQNGRQGDIFVQKSPATTINCLAIALKEIYNSDISTKIIGTRHGEKLFETLVTREEMAKVKEYELYFKVPPDSRDLNYNQYYDIGESKIAQVKEYNSHNTYRLTTEETKKLLLNLDFIKQDIKK
jgi:UDP-N-acetylglucosamine 4,6-dehydratase